MDDDQVPIGMLADVLLPDGLCAELGVASILAEDDCLLTFRIDPGNAFARRAYIRNAEGTKFLVGVSERYLPNDPRRHVCGCDGIPAGDVPDQLRVVSGWAYNWDAEREHWQDARPQRTPSWTGSRRKLVEAAASATERARRERTAYFLHERPGRIVYGNNPPAQGVFYSVTVRGYWSLHQGRETYPLEGPPDATTVTTSQGKIAVRRKMSPARLALAHQPTEPALVIPFRQRTEPPKPQAAPRGRRL